MPRNEFTLSDEQRAKLALALTHRTSAQTGHLSESALAALIEHKGHSEEIEVWKQHLGECTECYRVFLDCAQWRLEFAEAQAEHERQRRAKAKGWLALLLGRWRFLVSSVASVFVVVVLFYLMPVNIPTPTAVQEQGSPISLERSEQTLPADPAIEIKSRSKHRTQKLASDLAHSSTVPAFSTGPAKGASGTTEEPPVSNEANVSAQAGIILDRTVPEAVVTPKLHELVAKSEVANTASMAATKEELGKKQGERRAVEAKENQAVASLSEKTESSGPQAMVPEQASVDNLPRAERIEVTGSRIKAEPMRDELLARIDVEAFALGAHHAQMRRNASKAQEVATAVPSDANTEMISVDKRRYATSRELGEWYHSAKAYCAQDSSSRQASEFVSLARRWPDLYTSLKLSSTQHSVWPVKINTVLLLCKISEEISVLME